MRPYTVEQRYSCWCADRHGIHSVAAFKSADPAQQSQQQKQEEQEQEQQQEESTALTPTGIETVAAKIKTVKPVAVAPATHVLKDATNSSKDLSTVKVKISHPSTPQVEAA